MLFEKSNAINFGNQKCHLKNQRRLILEIESVNKLRNQNASNFGNQKCHLRNQNASNFGNQVSFEKSNVTNLEIKCHLRNQNASNFGNQKCHLRNQTRQILEIKSVI